MCEHGRQNSVLSSTTSMRIVRAAVLLHVASSCVFKRPRTAVVERPCRSGDSHDGPGQYTSEGIEAADCQPENIACAVSGACL